MVGTASGVIFNKRGADFDCQLVRGATVDFELIWGGQSSPINVAGFDARLQVREVATDVSPAFEFTTGNGRVTIGGSSGTINFSMTDTDSAALTLGNYVYVLEVEDASGNNIPVMSGKLKVVPGAT